MNRTSASIGRRLRPPLSLGIIMAEHFSMSSFALFMDLMRLAADEGDLSRPVNIGWEVMSSRSSPMRASCGVEMNRTSEFVDPSRFDYIVVIGGLLHKGTQIDAATEAYLHEAARIGIPLIGICTGSFILCRAGLMSGRSACVNWYHYQDFIDEFPNQNVVADRIFLVDQDRITGPGGAGAADLALYLIRKHLGKATAQKAQEVLQFDRMRVGSEPPPHPPVTMSVSSPLVRRALLLMEQNMALPLTIAALATAVGLSSRQFERLFSKELQQTPAAVYRALRLRYATWLLTHSEQSVTEIALRSGFCDGPHFTRHYKDAYGMPPSGRRSETAIQDSSENARYLANA